MNESLEMLLHAKKIRYDYLDRLMKPILIKKNAPYQSINIIVDVHDMVKSLYKPDVAETINTITSLERREIAADLINLVSHYRHYFFSRWWKYTNFFFIYSSKRSKYHLEIDKEYRRDFYTKRLKEPNSKKYLPQYEILNTTLESAIKMCKTFLMYVPHAYFIDSGNVDYTLIPHILMNNIEGEKVVSGQTEPIFDRDCPTFILSNDEIFLQDLNQDNMLYPVMQLMMKGEKSVILDKDNAFDYLTKSLKKEPEFSFSFDLYDVIMSITGNTKYNISKINGMGIGRAITYLQKLYMNGEIDDIRYSSFSLFNNVIDNTSMKDEHKEIIKKNFRLMSHASMDNIAYSQSDIDIIKIECSKEIVDAKEVKRCNEKYFDTNPVILEFCYDGESY